jgi:salicylate 5-hydroxylase large subunit
VERATAVVMTTLFPERDHPAAGQFAVSTRHLQPVEPGVFDFVWTHFGFADEPDAAMTQRRLRQANLFGPAGFVSADDGEVIEFVQQRLQRPTRRRAPYSELDGRDGQADRAHGHRDADPRHVRLLATR